ncbi:hypothetical protein DAI22_11g217000 [Oryza sativa Japonica Group]|nr:hypothetical protein DAI22_11g217000 [Oryza sativa Japonica Group]KAF2911920.1 hypothetical protein DAI22_11g217000 [Oryza sativa Japonica Group]
MDGVGDGGGGGGPATGGRAGRGGVPDRRPRKSRFSVLASMEDDSAEEELEEYMDDLVRPGSAAFPSDRKWRQGRAEFARRHGHTVAGARTLIRQSVLYSDRPKRSQGRRGRVKPQTESLAEKDASEVSNSELGATTTDMPKFKTLSLNDSPSALDSADRATVRASSMDSDLPDSATAKLPDVEEALLPRSERKRKIHLYLAEHTFDDLREGFAAMINGFRDPPKDAAQPNVELPESSKLYPCEFDAESSHDSESLSPAAEDVGRHNLSTEEIVQNGKRWISEEVMLAFEKYIEGKNEFRDVVYHLDELQYQCFSVDAYQKIFHHYNFTVKMKKPTSEDWSVTCYFAEVKQVYGKKFYLCWPVKSHDDGYCHGCVNQGMVALKHPANDEVKYEVGFFDTGCPFMFWSDDDSDDDERVFSEESIKEIFSGIFG